MYERYMLILARTPATSVSRFVSLDRKAIASTGIDHEMVEVAGTITLVDSPVNLFKMDLDHIPQGVDLIKRAVLTLMNQQRPSSKFHLPRNDHVSNSTRRQTAVIKFDLIWEEMWSITVVMIQGREMNINSRKNVGIREVFIYL